MDWHGPTPTIRPFTGKPSACSYKRKKKIEKRLLSDKDFEVIF
jgi:hypothetical protein